MKQNPITIRTDVYEKPFRNLGERKSHNKVNR